MLAKEVKSIQESILLAEDPPESCLVTNPDQTRPVFLDLNQAIFRSHFHQLHPGFQWSLQPLPSLGQAISTQR